MENKKISIVMGSDSDFPVMKKTKDVLDDFEIQYEVKVLSAHRSPELTAKYAKEVKSKGIKVIIAGAGGAAHLAGVIAAHTTIPVIGVPITTSNFKGLDSLFSTIQMPGGIPVGTMGVGNSGAKNAAIFAIQLLALNDESLQKKLLNYKNELKESVNKKQSKVDSEINKD